MRSGCREEGRGGEGRRKEVMSEHIPTDDWGTRCAGELEWVRTQRLIQPLKAVSDINLKYSATQYRDEVCTRSLTNPFSNPSSNPVAEIDRKILHLSYPILSYQRIALECTGSVRTSDTATATNSIMQTLPCGVSFLLRIRSNTSSANGSNSGRGESGKGGRGGSETVKRGEIKEGNKGGQHG
jgi:hypothetical protein